jgi:hypothetical protein
MPELAYDDRATNFFTTNTTVFSTAAASLIGGLSVTVVGTGDPVEVEFYVPMMTHSASAIITSYFVVNGSVAQATGQYKNWAAAQGEGGSMRRRLVLENGVSYTYQVGLAGSANGTTAAYGQYTLGASAGLMYLRVYQ